MRNVKNWSPTKFVLKKKKLKASRDPSEVDPGSRLLGDILGRYYQKLLKKHARGRLLDLGCGNVPFYEVYEPLITENICIDWENSLHENAFLDYHMDLNEPIPLKESQFDTVILSDVLEHIREPEPLVGEIFRLLKKGGKLIMNVPFLYWLHEQPYDFFRYTQFALRSFAEEAGFDVVLLEPTGGAPEVLTDICAKLLKKVPLIGLPLAKFVQTLTWYFIQTGPGRKISQATAGYFPLGYFMVAQKPA